MHNGVTRSLVGSKDPLDPVLPRSMSGGKNCIWVKCNPYGVKIPFLCFFDNFFVALTD